MNHEYQAVLRVPFGALGLRVERDQLSGIDFLPATAETVAPQGELGRLASASLQQYLANPRHNFRLPLLLKGTPFQQRVWQAIAAIPSGSTLTYSELAAKVDSGPRAVANACGANPIPVIIPCHRVVHMDGTPSGYRWGVERKLALLGREACS